MDDVDGDGKDDIFMYGSSAAAFAGSHVVAFSSQSFVPLWTQAVNTIGNVVGTCRTAESVVLGDFDGDGFDDVAVGCPGVGGLSEVFVLDGRTGSEITRVTYPACCFGHFLGAPGDVNGDGYADLIVSTFFEQRVFLGPSGQFAYAIPGSEDSGLGAGGVGDIDMDGADDFVLGWGSTGVVDLHSGRTGALLGSTCVFPNGCGGVYGFEPIGLGDINGDQIPDFAVSAHNVLIPASNGGVGLIRMISGADLSTIHEVTGRPELSPESCREFLGQSLGGGHDLNGDGINDVVATGGDPFCFHSGIAISGRTGQILARVRPQIHGGELELSHPVHSDLFIDSATTLSDVDGDGYDDWAVTNSRAGFGGVLSGRVIILAGEPGDVEHVCDSVPQSLGAAARIYFYDAISVGTRGLEVHVEEAIPDSVALLLYGHRAPPVPFGDGVLCIDPQSAVRYGGPVRIGSNGSLTKSVDWGDSTLSQGAGAWAVGSSWTIQAVFRDPGAASGFNTTDAVEATFN
ncbi:FG-GAP repeat domain-containing protein [Saltatorellus ferox]